MVPHWLHSFYLLIYPLILHILSFIRSIWLYIFYFILRHVLWSSMLKLVLLMHYPHALNSNKASYCYHLLLYVRSLSSRLHHELWSRVQTKKKKKTIFLARAYSHAGFLPHFCNCGFRSSTYPRRRLKSRGEHAPMSCMKLHARAGEKYQVAQSRVRRDLLFRVAFWQVPRLKAVSSQWAFSPVG